jgi:uncharacterized membrane protein
MKAATSKPTLFLGAILAIQFALCFSVFFDITVARQIIGLLYLTFIPGFVVLKLLKMSKLDTVESILFSTGFSIAFLMLLGLLVNEIGPLIGIWAPLETTPIIVPVSCFVLIGATLYYLRNTRNVNFDTEGTRIPLRSLIFLALPVISIVGAFWANTTGNSSILLFMILIAVTVSATSILSERFIPPEYYALIVFSIALALLFHSSLTSSYILGGDIHSEYSIFKLTQNRAYWDSSASFSQISFGRYNDMLSITILPTVYSSILNTDGTWILKIVFPLIFSLVPVVAFKIWQVKWGKKAALVSAILLISQNTFYIEMVGLARQMIAELFFVLLLFVLFSEKLDTRSGKFCFIVFSIALVMSHYSIALIFLFFISGTWLLMLLVKKEPGRVAVVHVILFAVVMFSWYIFTSSAASFQSILQASEYIREQLGSFFSPASRGTEVMRGLGMETAQSNWQALSRIFAYATQFFIVIGFASLIIKRKNVKIYWDYFFISSLGIVLLAMTILLPGFAQSLQMTRFYHIILLLIAPFFVLGCETCVSLLEKKHVLHKTQIQASIVMTMILVAYFLFQTNFVYEVVGATSWSVPLSKYRMDKTLLFFSAGYVDEQMVLGSQWLSRNVDVKNSEVYADITSLLFVLQSYGGLRQGNYWTNTSAIAKNGVLYLHVVDGKIIDPNYAWNYSELSNQLEHVDKIYSNEESEIWSNFTNVTNP